MPMTGDKSSAKCQGFPCQGVKVSRCQGVKGNFHRAALGAIGCILSASPAKSSGEYVEENWMAGGEAGSGHTSPNGAK